MSSVEELGQSCMEAQSGICLIVMLSVDKSSSLIRMVRLVNFDRY
jgi:hypothetical protein